MQVIRHTASKQKTKWIRSEELSEKYLKKLKDPKCLTADQIWTIYKGMGTREDIPIEFIIDFANRKSITLDMIGFDKLFIEETEKSLKNVKHVRHENTQLIDICRQLKQIYKVPFTKDEFKYNYELDTVNQVAKYKDGNCSLSDFNFLTQLTNLLFIL